MGLYAVSPVGDVILEETWTKDVETPSGDLGLLAGRLQLVDTQTGDAVRAFEDSCEYYVAYETELIETVPECLNYVQPSDMQFSADGSRVALLGSNRSAAVYDTATGERLWDHPPDPELPFFSRFTNQGAISPDGSIFVAALDLDGDGTTEFTVVDIDDGETVATWVISSSITDALFHPTEPVLFVALGASDVQVIDTTSWEVVRTLERAQGGAVRALALSPDGRVLAASSDDRILRLWDWNAGTISSEIEVVDARQIVFLDDDHIFLVSFDGNSATLTLDREELAAIGRVRLTRSFTEEECDTYGIDPCPTLEDIKSGSA
jgi:WD40 repeat protein